MDLELKCGLVDCCKMLLYALCAALSCGQSARQTHAPAPERNPSPDLSKCFVRSALSKEVGTKHLVLSTCHEHFVQSVGYQVPDVVYSVHSTCYRVLGTRHLVTSTQYKLLSTEHVVPRIWPKNACKEVMTRMVILKQTCNNCFLH